VLDSILTELLVLHVLPQLLINVIKHVYHKDGILLPFKQHQVKLLPLLIHVINVELVKVNVNKYHNQQLLHQLLLDVNQDII